MPPPHDAALLTDAHRAAQSRIGAETVRSLLAAFRLLDPTNIDASVQRWLSVVVPIVARQRAKSALLAANYLGVLRAIEVGMTAAAFTPAVLDAIDTQQVTRSLTVTGPAAMKLGQKRGLTFAQLLDLGAARSSAAGMRHALAGGRDTIEAAVSADRAALGYVRVTGGKACAFCQMLCSRGAVYKTEMSAEMANVGHHPRGHRGAGASYHDGCNCISKPIYRTDDPILARSDTLRRRWSEATQGTSGADALNAFRRSLEAGR